MVDFFFWFFFFLQGSGYDYSSNCHENNDKQIIPHTSSYLHPTCIEEEEEDQSEREKKTKAPPPHMDAAIARRPEFASKTNIIITNQPHHMAHTAVHNLRKQTEKKKKHKDTLHRRVAYCVHNMPQTVCLSVSQARSCVLPVLSGKPIRYVDGCRNLDMVCMRIDICPCLARTAS